MKVSNSPGMTPLQGGSGAVNAQIRIPPGLAKKKANQLPDGNPWKALLLMQEQAQGNGPMMLMG